MTQSLLTFCSIRNSVYVHRQSRGRFVGQCSVIFVNMATVDRLYALYNIISDAKDEAAEVSKECKAAVKLFSASKMHASFQKDQWGNEKPFLRSGEASLELMCNVIRIRIRSNGGEQVWLSDWMIKCGFVMRWYSLPGVETGNEMCRDAHSLPTLRLGVEYLSLSCRLCGNLRVIWPCEILKDIGRDGVRVAFIETLCIW